VRHRGLYRKYRVIKRGTGQEITGPVFVLRPDRDPAAREALLTYARTTPNKVLAEDIESWLAAKEEEIRFDRRRGRE